MSILEIMVKNKKASLVFIFLFPIYIVLYIWEWLLSELQEDAKSMLDTYDDWLKRVLAKFTKAKETI